MLKNISIRPIRSEDLATLDTWRRLYPDAFLELPKGVAANGVETAVAEKNGQLLGSLTGTLAIVCDPFIKNPDARRVDVFGAVYMLERTLAYRGQAAGAVDAYIAVPSPLKDYHEIVKRSGYIETCQNCTIFRRPLQPDTVPLLEDAQTERVK